MGFAEMMAEAVGGMGEDGGESWNVEDLNAVRDGLARKRLENLQPGDLVVQVKRGDRYVNKCEDRPVIFVRYLTEAERVAFGCSKGQKYSTYDGLISYFVDKRDGEVCLFAVDTSFFERYTHPAAKIIAEAEVV